MTRESHDDSAPRSGTAPRPKPNPPPPQPPPRRNKAAVAKDMGALGSGSNGPIRNLGTAIYELFRPLGGVDLEIPPREPMREPPGFD